MAARPPELPEELDTVIEREHPAGVAAALQNYSDVSDEFTLEELCLAVAQSRMSRTDFRVPLKIRRFIEKMSSYLPDDRVEAEEIFAAVEIRTADDVVAAAEQIYENEALKRDYKRKQLETLVRKANRNDIEITAQRLQAELQSPSRPSENTSVETTSLGKEQTDAQPGREGRETHGDSEHPNQDGYSKQNADDHDFEQQEEDSQAEENSGEWEVTRLDNVDEAQSADSFDSDSDRETGPSTGTLDDASTEAETEVESPEPPTQSESQDQDTPGSSETEQVDGADDNWVWGEGKKEIEGASDGEIRQQIEAIGWENSSPVGSTEGATDDEIKEQIESIETEDSSVEGDTPSFDAEDVTTTSPHTEEDETNEEEEDDTGVDGELELNIPPDDVSREGESSHRGEDSDTPPELERWKQKALAGEVRRDDLLRLPTEVLKRMLEEISTELLTRDYRSEKGIDEGEASAGNTIGRDRLEAQAKLIYRQLESRGSFEGEGPDDR